MAGFVDEDSNGDVSFRPPRRIPPTRHFEDSRSSEDGTPESHDFPLPREGKRPFEKAFGGAAQAEIEEDEEEEEKEIQPARKARRRSSGAPSRVKGPWTDEEDRLLHDLVQRHGPRSWRLIADHMHGRCVPPPTVMLMRSEFRLFVTFLCIEIK